MKHYEKEYGKLRSVLCSVIEKRKLVREERRKSVSDRYSDFLDAEIVRLDRIEHYATLAMTEIDNLNK